MRIFLLGADGQLGFELGGALGCFAQVTALLESALDMTDAAALRRTLRDVAPDVVVNAAAYTDVDGAERNPDAAARVNCHAVRTLGQWAVDTGKLLLHYSTDFVFDGQATRPYVEQDEPRPLGVYGRSKLDGEQVLAELEAPAIVLRTAWVYSLRRKSFVSQILRLAREREQLRVVDDQVGSPTFCRDLAQASALLLYGLRGASTDELQAVRGVYHLAGSGACSRFELARAAVELDPHRREQRVAELARCSTSDFPMVASRPAFAPLDCGLAERRFGIRLPDWREALARALGAES
jgi:dTDP-4-dehydrorhamnose reductase